MIEVSDPTDQEINEVEFSSPLKKIPAFSPSNLYNYGFNNHERVPNSIIINGQNTEAAKSTTNSLFGKGESSAFRPVDQPNNSSNRSFNLTPGHHVQSLSSQLQTSGEFASGPFDLSAFPMPRNLMESYHQESDSHAFTSSDNATNTEPSSPNDVLNIVNQLVKSRHIRSSVEFDALRLFEDEKRDDRQSTSGQIFEFRATFSKPDAFQSSLSSSFESKFSLPSSASSSVEYSNNSNGFNAVGGVLGGQMVGDEGLVSLSASLGSRDSVSIDGTGATRVGVESGDMQWATTCRYPTLEERQQQQLQQQMHAFSMSRSLSEEQYHSASGNGNLDPRVRLRMDDIRTNLMRTSADGRLQSQTVGSDARPPPVPLQHGHYAQQDNMLRQAPSVRPGGWPGGASDRDDWSTQRESVQNMNYAGVRQNTGANVSHAANMSSLETNMHQMYVSGHPPHHHQWQHGLVNIENSPLGVSVHNQPTFAPTARAPEWINRLPYQQSFLQTLQQRPPPLLNQLQQLQQQQTSHLEHQQSRQMLHSATLQQQQPNIYSGRAEIRDYPHQTSAPKLEQQHQMSNVSNIFPYDHHHQQQQYEASLPRLLPSNSPSRSRAPTSSSASDRAVASGDLESKLSPFPDFNPQQSSSFDGGHRMEANTLGHFISPAQSSGSLSNHFQAYSGRAISSSHNNTGGGIKGSQFSTASRLDESSVRHASSVPGSQYISENPTAPYSHDITNRKFNTIASASVQAPHDQKLSRQELVESPTSKSAYKNFYRQFRIKEKESLEAAKSYAEQSLSWMPHKTVWRVKLELAEMAKRRNDFDKARELYGEVCLLQPLASQGWLEWSKMEEECGHTPRSLKILKVGLLCSFNEALLTRAIKQQERLHDMQSARHMLSVVKHEAIDKVWRAVFEGALLEARAGQTFVARQILKYLIENVPWYGPIYHEAYKLEEKLSRPAAAMLIVRRGLRVLPRYGPLWFSLLKMVERLDVQQERPMWHSGQAPRLTRLRTEVARAVRSISRELVWKVHFELSQAEERAAEVAALGLHNLSSRSLSSARNDLLGEARKVLIRAMLSCPANLRWKIWLAGARLELSAGNLAETRRLICKALVEVPPKSKAYVYLECSRVEEYVGNIEAARKILARACIEVRTEWKVFLEAVLLETRAGDIPRAIQLTNVALKYHAGTGRLWAVLIQLRHRLENSLQIHAHAVGQEGEEGAVSGCLVGVATDTDDAESDASGTSGSYSARSGALPPLPRPISGARYLDHGRDKEEVLLRALLEVPKSGEVWCEGARCQMNPMLVHSFDLRTAQRNLSFAIQFTPQYGDTFIECLKLEMLIQVFLPRVLAMLGLPLVPFVRRFLSLDPDADISSMLDDFRSLQDICMLEFPISAPAGDQFRGHRRLVIAEIEQLRVNLPGLVEALKLIQKSNVERRCANAEPNYGTSWFYCRASPIDQPTVSLAMAHEILVHELFSAQALYVRAIFHFIMKNVMTALTSTSSASGQPTGPPSRRPSSAPPNSRSHPKIETSRSRGAASTRLTQNDRVFFPPTPTGADGTAAVVVSVTSQSILSTAPGHGASADQPQPPGGYAVAPQISVTSSGSGISFSTLLRSGTTAGSSEHEHQQRSSGITDNDLLALLEAQEDGIDQRPREIELIEDLQFIVANSDHYLRAWPLRSLGLKYLFAESESGRDSRHRYKKSITPRFVAVEDVIYASTDFVTALVGLNRLVFDRHLDDEDRRKVLFGSDQILA